MTVTPDFINGMFESIGGGLVLTNCLRLYRDKEIKGVSIFPTAFFSVWGIWNLYYYPNLKQWLSFTGGLLVTLANVIWVCMAIYYIRKKKKKEKEEI